MTSYRADARAQIDEALAINRNLRRNTSHLAEDSSMRRMLRQEHLEIIDRLVNLASLDGLDGQAAHPPVPEQAGTAEQDAWIAENSDLWAGWQPGRWPAHDALDPRGYRWETMP